MNYSALIWLLCNIFSIIVLAFYSMLEMACVSFNKVRLQYYVSKGYKRAIWLNYLLHHPSRLFGTTLIGVNIALVVGSECSREFYAALGLSPDLSPLTQVIIVVIFGELAPMFAARRYAEHVAMLGVPIIYASAKLMTPLLWVINWISKVCNTLLGGKESGKNIYLLSQEELQKVIEDQDEDASYSENAEFRAITANIFRLRGKDVRQIMKPLGSIKALSSNATIAQMESLIARSKALSVPIYHREITNIVGIAYPRDAMRAAPTHRIREYARPPWFVTETTSMMDILKQFRSNNENVAFILNQHGKAIGFIELADILEEVFGKISLTGQATLQRKKQMLIEKTFPGDTTVQEFHAQFGVSLDKNSAMTLSELLSSRLGRRPEKGDIIYIAPFELEVKETSLLDVKTISVSTRMT